jgi:hypothetical protein
VVEHSLGKGEVESSILSRSTIKSQGLSTFSDFPWENEAFQKYATKRENTGGNGKKLGRSWAGSPGRVFIMFTVTVLARPCQGVFQTPAINRHVYSSPFVCAASKDASAAPVNLAMATSY